MGFLDMNITHYVCTGFRLEFGTYTRRYQFLSFTTRVVVVVERYFAPLSPILVYPDPGRRYRTIVSKRVRDTHRTCVRNFLGHTVHPDKKI